MSRKNNFGGKNITYFLVIIILLLGLFYLFKSNFGGSQKNPIDILFETVSKIGDDTQDLKLSTDAAINQKVSIITAMKSSNEASKICADLISLALTSALDANTKQKAQDAAKLAANSATTSVAKSASAKVLATKTQEAMVAAKTALDTLRKAQDAANNAMNKSQEVINILM